MSVILDKVLSISLLHEFIACMGRGSSLMHFMYAVAS